MVTQGEVNAELTLKLINAKKDKGANLNGEVAKAMKTQTLELFTSKDMKVERVRQWGLQVEAYFESQVINTNVNHFILTQLFFEGSCLGMVDDTKGCQAQLDGNLALDCVQGQVE